MNTFIADSKADKQSGTTMQTTANSQRPDYAHDVLGAHRHPLASIFSPKVVAVIGATESAGSVGRTVFQNLGRGGFDGVVYPVNPKRNSVLFVKVYLNIVVVFEKVDLVVICTLAKIVLVII